MHEITTQKEKKKKDIQQILLVPEMDLYKEKGEFNNISFFIDFISLKTKRYNICNDQLNYVNLMMNAVK